MSAGAPLGVGLLFVAALATGCGPSPGAVDEPRETLRPGAETTLVTSLAGTNQDLDLVVGGRLFGAPDTVELTVETHPADTSASDPTEPPPRLRLHLETLSGEPLLVRDLPEDGSPDDPLVVALSPTARTTRLRLEVLDACDPVGVTLRLSPPRSTTDADRDLRRYESLRAVAVARAAARADTAVDATNDKGIDARIDAALDALDRLPDAESSAIDRLNDFAFTLFSGPTSDLACERAQAMLEDVFARQQADGATGEELAGSAATVSRLAQDRGAWDDAVTWLDTARDHQPADDESLRFDHLLERALIDHHRGLLASAGRALEDARTIADAWDDPLARAEVAHQLGDVLRAQGDFERAGELLDAGLADLERAPEADPELEWVLRETRAGLWKDLGRLDRAAEALVAVEDERRALACVTGSHDDAVTLLNRAEIRRLQARLGEAADDYAAALRLARRPPIGCRRADRAVFATQAAVLDAERGRFGRARRLLTEARATSVSDLDRARVDLELADLLCADGDHARPARGLDAARSAHRLRTESLGADHPEVAIAALAIARCRHRAGDTPSLPEVARARATLERSRLEPAALIGALQLEAALLQATGQPAAADLALAKALDAADALRVTAGGGWTTRSEVLARHLDVVDSLVEARVDRGLAGSALVASERGRARSLAERIRLPDGDGVAANPQADSEVAALAAAARAELAEAVLRRDRERGAGRFEQAAQHEATAEAAARRLDRLNGRRLTEGLRDPARDPREATATLDTNDTNDTNDSHATAIARLRASLSTSRRALVYHVGARRSFAFVVGGPEQQVLVHELTSTQQRPIGRAALRAHIEQPPSLTIQIAAAGSSLDGRLQRRLETLADLLVPAPLRAVLRDAESVVVVADPPLDAVPLVALPWADLPVDGAAPNAPEHAPPTLWLDAGPLLVHAPSLAIAAELATNRATDSARWSDRALLVATDGETDDPFLGDTTRDAAQRALLRLGATELVVRYGGAATEGRIRADLARRPRWIVAFTHGVASRGASGAIGALVLQPGAGDPDDDGRLLAQEIDALDLDADLVLLAACSGAVGRPTVGEGADSLAHSFLAAGARGVVASRWPVQVAATETFIAELFAAVADDGDWARALREAQRRTRERHAGVDRWAPFYLLGAPPSGEPPSAESRRDSQRLATSTSSG